MDDLSDTTFTCLFCHHDNSVTVKLDRKEGVAQLVCKICGQSFQSKVNRTSCTLCDILRYLAEKLIVT